MRGIVGSMEQLIINRKIIIRLEIKNVINVKNKNSPLTQSRHISSMETFKSTFYVVNIPRADCQV